MNADILTGVDDIRETFVVISLDKFSFDILFCLQHHLESIKREMTVSKKNVLECQPFNYFLY